MGSLRSEALRDVFENLSTERRRINALTAWVVPLALAMSPARYAELGAILGARTQYGPEIHEEQIDRVEDPTIDEARWAVDEVAQLVFRLWEIGSMRGDHVQNAAGPSAHAPTHRSVQG